MRLLFSKIFLSIFVWVALGRDTFAASSLMNLVSIQKGLGLPESDVRTNRVVISDGTNRIVFHPGYRRAELNGTAIWLNGAANANFREKLTLAREDYERFLQPLLRGKPPAVTNGEFRVFLDAGHGGEDGGAISPINKQLEKDLVLDITQRVGMRLEDAGLVVQYSRTNDTFVSLEDRSVLARKGRASIFVSIHANTTSGKNARGMETFALTLAGFDSTTAESRVGLGERVGNAHDVGSAILAYLIHTRLPGRRGEADRGLRRARFQVLRQAPCPAVLVECGFLSNATETRGLASMRFREKVAMAIAEGILDYAQRASHDEHLSQ